MRKHGHTIITILLSILFLFSAIMFIRQQRDNRIGAVAYESAQQVATAVTVAPIATTPPAIPEVPETATFAVVSEPKWIPAPIDEEDPHISILQSIHLPSLQKVNPDVIGWISIPDTQIYYPLLQGEDNEYYLSHTWNNQSSSVGAIFLETRNDPGLAEFNTIVYGHNMKDGSMFADIRQYSDQQFWEQHPYVYLYTEEGVFRYEIFAAYQAAVTSSTYGLSFHQEETKVKFLADAAERNRIETGISPELTDRILTLSTCTGTGYSSRWVVQARLKMIYTN